MHRSTLRQLLEFYSARVPYHRGKWIIVDSILRATKLEEPDRGRTHAAERSGLQWRLNPNCTVPRQPLTPSTQIGHRESYTDGFCVPRD